MRYNIRAAPLVEVAPFLAYFVPVTTMLGEGGLQCIMDESRHPGTLTYFRGRRRLVIDYSSRHWITWQEELSIWSRWLEKRRAGLQRNYKRYCEIMREHGAEPELLNERHQEVTKAKEQAEHMSFVNASGRRWSI